MIQNRSFRNLGEAAAAPADYELLEVIGEGGVGVVYAARQASINRVVAVKMLRPGREGQSQRDAFLAEAVVTGDLDHPNIVPVHDLGGNQTGDLFYSMKRVLGTPWSRVIRRKSLPENLEILHKVCDAVAFAHSRNVVHRDLKPENVMLGDFGEVLLMDWGIALASTLSIHTGRAASSSSMGGTPAYMSPEMATGPIEKIGPRSDVYLLGGILFEILTGKTPHAGKSVMDCLLAAAENVLQPTDAAGELLQTAYRRWRRTRPTASRASRPSRRPSASTNRTRKVSRWRCARKRNYRPRSKRMTISTTATPCSAFKNRCSYGMPIGTPPRVCPAPGWRTPSARCAERISISACRCWSSRIRATPPCGANCWRPSASATPGNSG